MTLKPVTSSSTALTLKGTPPATLDPLQQLLAMSNEEISQHGIPKPLFEAWRDAFYQGFENETHTQIRSYFTQWAFKPEFVPTNPNCADEFTTAFRPLATPQCWANSEIHREILVKLYCLQHTNHFPSGNLVKQVFVKLMDCLAEKIAAEEHSPPHFVVDLPRTKQHTITLPNGGKLLEFSTFKKLFCFKTEQGWCIGDFERAQNNPAYYIVQFDIDRSRVLVLNKDMQLIDQPRTIVQARARDRGVFSTGKSIPSNSAGTIPKVDIIFYRGSNGLCQGENNAVTFTFDVDLNTQQMVRFKQNTFCENADVCSAQQLQTVQEQAEALFEAFRKELSSVHDFTQPLAFELTPPQSRADQLAVAVQMLLKWKENPDEHVDVIQEAANLFGCEFSPKEVQDLGQKATNTEDGYDIAPAAVVDKLFDTARTEWGKELKAEQKPKAATLHQPETKTENPQEPTIDQAALQRRQVEKERRRAAFLEQKRETTSQSTAAAEETTPQPLSLLGASSKDRAQVESIYKGNPMGAKTFASFAMALLRKKAAAHGASVQSHTKGSHPKLHFKRTDGTSGGVTFKIHHGKKDGHGFLAAQKQTLQRIFSL